MIMAVPDGAFETTQGREIDALMAQVGLRGSAPAVESPAAVAEPEIDAGDPDVVVLTPRARAGSAECRVPGLASAGIVRVSTVDSPLGLRASRNSR